MTTLILNADVSPISYLPLSVISWEEAIKYLVGEKAVVLEWYEDWTVRSERWSTQVPAVMMLKVFQRKKNAVRFSKQNVFLRDSYICQYCGCQVNKRSATLDHVLPVSHGGRNTWENCTTACATCNSLKGSDSKIVPSSRPYRPNYYSLVDKRKKLGWEVAHPSWTSYLEY
jgi:5-methylcytosine-specific restriction endonuclease McrA